MERRVACGLVLIGLRSPTGAPRNLSEIERATFRAVNQQRRKHGIGELAWNEELARQAHAHSRSMAERGFFSHRDPVRGDLPDRLNRGGVKFRGCAENIFKEQGYSDPVDQAVQRWLLSTGHRRNMLNGLYTRSAVGVAAASDGTLYFTQIFTVP